MQAPSSALVFDQLHVHGIPTSDAGPLAASLLCAWSAGVLAQDGRQALAKLAVALSPSSRFDGLQFAKEWLEDPGLSAIQWQAVDAAWQKLSVKSPNNVDWTAEATALLCQPIQYGPTQIAMPIARAIADIVRPKASSESCACLFQTAATLAWALAETRPVTFIPGNADIAMIVALLAYAGKRPIRVDRRNPVDGSFMTVGSDSANGNREPPFSHFDHIVSVPPFGMRLDGAKLSTMEAHQTDLFVRRAKRSFTTLTVDGFLFRENRGETELRQRLLGKYTASIMSMPAGMLAPSINVQTSLLRLEPGADDFVYMIDARSMPKSSRGRVQDHLIAKHLAAFAGFTASDEDRFYQAPLDDVAAAQYSLLPDRYMKSNVLAAIDAALQDKETVRLGDIATIERGKAPQPIRTLVEDPPLAGLEIVPSDIVDGRVRTPSRQVAFEGAEIERAKNVAAKYNDILISIKGNIGVVGIVDSGAILAEVMNEPWIISQSLAIIRWRPNNFIPSAAILNALLTAPWAREKFESLGGATTVKLLPIGALSTMQIPVPSAEECQAAQTVLESMEAMRADIDARTANLKAKRDALWNQLWHLNNPSGENEQHAQS
jgi:hypothetical protein